MLDLRWRHRSYKEEDKCAFLTNILGPYNSFMHLCIHYSVQQIALVIKSMETRGVEYIKIEWVSASYNRLSDIDIH